MTNHEGKIIQELFCHSLGHAVQWYDVLQVEVEHCIHAMKPLSSGSCATLLVQQHPTCFSGNTFRQAFSDSGDIHVATDGNFHHQHQCSAGNCPSFYNPVYFLLKGQVDAVGQCVAKAHKCQPKKHQALVPNEAINQCEISYEAKAAMDGLYDTGIMALICHHDIPLFVANIDSLEASVVVLYDIGCVLAWSLTQYNLLDDSITSHLRFATMAMHAYGHEWACQLVYNPQLAISLGLSDGEGMERLWSRFIKLIGIERASLHQHCIWLIDHQAAAVGHDMRKDLGLWLKRQMKKGVGKQGAAAQDVIEACEVPVSELQTQWTKQHSAQLSVRAYAPVRLKKELGSVLSLQANLDSSEQVLQAACVTIEKSNMSEETLQGIQLEFMWLLLMAHDLKINIWKRAIGSFFEWYRLDRAVGGKDETLGRVIFIISSFIVLIITSTLHISKPVLMAVVHKYSKYFHQLEDLHDSSYTLPLPKPLLTKLMELCSDQMLLQDVWISPSIREIPCWLEDVSVHNGICGLLKCDCCQEEQWRLGMEVDNMCHWFSIELSAIELALCLPENSMYYLILQHYREAMLELQEQWPTALASPVHYACKAREALALAEPLSGAPSTLELHWLQLVDAKEDREAPEAWASHSATNYILNPEEILLGNELEVNDLEDDNEERDDVLPPVDLRWNPQARDITILGSDNAWLNDTCINGCTTLLHSHYPLVHSKQITIFSMHDLLCICYNATDKVLWCNMLHTKYWEKSTWILPIHQPSAGGHWVLYTIKLTSKKLIIFDSLAEQKLWKNVIEDITKLVSCLLIIASKKLSLPCRDPGDWTASPIMVCCCHPLQRSNTSINCCLWVLAQFVAVIQGYNMTGLQEQTCASMQWTVDGPAIFHKDASKAERGSWVLSGGDFDEADPH
ncbi:hypothetical protein PAXRUDRAFT_33373 [Paxillus rubicundulus Ve08.2h10]|uniref:Unplaced genomic scaffold scaffold_267, whole genome shotgun sequence n=1 Tax=Paxillus rubicundulus Ve08.2h10 TaxID=930991 RepID=A0A0D0DBZ4_9AGAM|nr:hypothetical protein PAXRUDRAFT_33373 [Paxillus rubicundulus Ve08.2h10]